MRLLSNITFLCALLAAVSGCGGKGGPIQPDPQPAEVRLACPAAIVREATSVDGTDVHFDAPVPTSGTAPFDVQCEPGSSSVFPIGETTVRCTARAADKGQASCSFPVTVRTSRMIAKTRFMAFGDSITEGAVSLAPLIMLDGPETYPFKLEQMLRERYFGQNIVVLNRGFAGDDTRDGARRLPQILQTDKPEVMLLLEGINNLGASTSTQVTAIRTMILEAKTQGVDMIIATVMPVLPRWRLYTSSTMPKIQALNTEIFVLAAQYELGAPVDLFALFQARPELIGIDGLHPTLEGQTEIARAFRDEIVRRYDNSSTTSLRFFTMRNTR